MPRYYSPRTYQGAKRQLIYGIVLFLIGIAVTVGTYTWASQNGGGTYIISFGPIIFGLIRILTALPLVIRGRGQVAVQTGPMRAGGPVPAQAPWAGQQASQPVPASPWGASAGGPAPSWNSGGLAAGASAAPGFATSAPWLGGPAIAAGSGAGSVPWSAGGAVGASASATPASAPWSAGGAVGASAATASAPWSAGGASGVGASGGGASPVAGWYADPSGANGVRWWDGAQWTNQTRPNP
ncbi:MAG TPA: DUF2510 domain-containing protein [Acidimicrobiales bacterium]|nr:DUF2510 domain-containing protein [Acidimicrobiales bacterium]